MDHSPFPRQKGERRDQDGEYEGADRSAREEHKRHLKGEEDLPVICGDVVYKTDRRAGISQTLVAPVPGTPKTELKCLIWTSALYQPSIQEGVCFVSSAFPHPEAHVNNIVGTERTRVRVADICGQCLWPTTGHCRYGLSELSGRSFAVTRKHQPLFTSPGHNVGQQKLLFSGACTILRMKDVGARARGALRPERRGYRQIIHGVHAACTISV
ncbi:hypothetical protein J6590_027768 [Homalodisca vitripennis]|nr:hypothetical protein J6590_027768 [Homalodisca vitripennis]